MQTVGQDGKWNWREASLENNMHNLMQDSGMEEVTISKGNYNDVVRIEEQRYTLL